MLDTLVEKLDGEAGSDIAVILAGYKQEMFDMLDNNPGLRRRFNIDDFPFHFQDMSDEELKQVLISMTGKAGLVFGSVELVDDVVAVIAQKRKMPGFGNAGTVGSMINFAKASKAARLAEAQRLFDEAKRKGTSLPTLPDPNVLFRDDFIPHESDDDKAQAAFADLYNTDHIMKHLNKLEALISVAKEDGLEPADILLDSHMVFVGPPGTGKTTVAKRFGRLFKDLDLLPSDNVITVTGTSMMGQYVGETKEKVLKYMNQARGGVLFVDEAYGMMGGSWGTDGGRSSYGKEAIDTMVGSITSDDFKGNLLVIMAGYEESMDSLFANANPGFASRFNKRRIVFNPWTAQQASEAVITEIARRGLTLTPEAEKLVQFYFRKLELLSSWGSARDVFDTVLPKLYEERASRRKASKLSNTEPYQAEDVEAALRPILENRQKLKVYANSTKRTSRASHREREASDVASDVEDHSARAEDSNGATTSYEGKSKHKLNVKHKISRIDDHEDSEDIGSNIDILGALEQACQELGYDEEKFAEILGERGMYPQELLDKVALLTGNIDTANIPSMLDKQKGNFLMRIKMCIEQRKKEKSAEEARCQEALKQMGQCPLGFDWLKEEGGWRCAGGSHFVSDNEIAQC